MRLVIEIDNAALREAVEAQVGKALAIMTEEVILAKADEIIARKFERFNFDQAVENFIARAVQPKFDQAIRSALGCGSYDQNEKIRQIFKDAAASMIKSALK